MEYYEEKANPMKMFGSEMAGMDEDAMKDMASALFAGFPKAIVQDYGMTGKVELLTYTVEKIF